MTDYILNELFPNFFSISAALCNQSDGAKIAGTSVTPSSTVSSSATENIGQSTRKIMSVSFHPAIVTDVRIRPSIPKEDKSKLFFTRNELKRYRDEERTQQIQKDTITAVIQGQQKYQRCQGRHAATTTVISRVSIM